MVDEPTIELRPFDRSLPMALLRAREATMRFFRPLLSEHELTEQQWRVLRALTMSDQPMEIARLADATFLLAPSLTRILANLGGRGLVERTVVAHDQRRATITLTATGRQLVAAVAPHSEARYDAIEDSFGRDEMTQLMGLLDRLAAIERSPRS